MSQLERLTDWYDAQCDGDWEHAFGVTVDTLDNPGWRVMFNLKFPLVGQAPVSERRSDTDWTAYETNGTELRAFGGTFNLEEILEKSLDWLDSGAQ